MPEDGIRASRTYTTVEKVDLSFSEFMERYAFTPIELSSGPPKEPFRNYSRMSRKDRRAARKAERQRRGQ